jgi:hypothetical protein
MKVHKLKHISKSEDPKAYAKLANTGVLLGYPVSIGGQSHRPDNGVQYHSTIKYFDQAADHPHLIHGIARHLPLNPPDAKNTQIKFDVFKDRMGNDVHTVTLHGNSADKLKEHNGKFNSMGFPSNFEWKPHVSVDKATWDKLKSSGAKTAHEAGISFGPAVLKKGPKVLKTYNQQPDTNEPAVPDHGDFTSRAKLAVAKSEEVLEKGALKNAGIALGMAGALGGTSHNVAAANRPPHTIQHEKTQPKPKYDHKRMMNTISQIESSGGKDVNHKPTANGTAYGKYAIMPGTIKDVINGNKDLKAKHGKALALNGDTLHRYMDDNKGLDEEIASRHLAHIESHFKDNPEKIGFSWNQGITGTKKAKPESISNHPYTKKIMNEYNKGQK